MKPRRLWHSRTAEARRAAGAAILLCVASIMACAGDAVGPLDVDLSQSMISVEPGPYIAGDFYHATVVLRSPNGQPFTGDVKLVPWLVGGSSVADFHGIDRSFDGEWLVSFEPRFVGAGSRLRVRVDGVGELTSAQEIAIVPGPADHWCTGIRGSTPRT